MVKNITIIGAGLTGLSLSLFLAKRGYHISVYESRPEIDQEPSAYISGRTMSLDLSARGIAALSKIGVLESILKHAVPMRRRVYHDSSGQLDYLNYGRHDDEYIHAVSRYEVYKSLIHQAKNNQHIRVFFNQKFIDWDILSDEIIFENNNHQQTHRVHADIVIGCDGAHSNMRTLLEEQLEIYFRRHCLKQHYKELTIPSDKAAQLEKQAMHIWSRGAFKLVAQPNYDGSFTCALLLAKTGEMSFQQLLNKQDIEYLFEKHFPDVYPLMPDLIEEFSRNPIGDLWTISGGHWLLNKKILILGDAAHAMVPFFGQGMNCALEDCMIFNQYLDHFNDDWQQALVAFAFERIIDTDAISTLSLDNYPELLNPEIQQKSFLKKKIEQILMRNYIKDYTSYHNMVCFEQVPYRYAQVCKIFQQQLLNHLSHGIHYTDELDNKTVQDALKIYNKNIKQFERLKNGSTHEY